MILSRLSIVGKCKDDSLHYYCLPFISLCAVMSECISVVGMDTVNYMYALQYMNLTLIAWMKTPKLGVSNDTSSYDEMSSD